MLLHTQAERLPVSDAALRAGLSGARNPGRMECFGGEVETVLDVAHNPHAAQALAAALRARPVAGRTLALFSVLVDKDLPGLVAPLCEVVDGWVACALDGPRGRDSAEIAAAISALGGRVLGEAGSPAAGYDLARALARPGDRILVAGSFLTVAGVRPLLSGN
jgi:dihydrofolate synthase/folylpolyglutamate synthase